MSASIAWGFEVDCDQADGNQLTYHINSDDFTASELSAIHAGADAWTAGDGEIMRGATWSFVPGSNWSTDGSLCDGSNTVRMKPRSWFNDQGIPNASARVHTCTVFCERIDADMTFAADVDWVTTMASDTDLPERALSQTAMHEFGHMYALLDEADEVATMNSAYPHAGDTAETLLRISEDDYLGLLYWKADSSIGFNLFLQRWDGGIGNNNEEVWTTANDVEENNRTWDADPGETISANAGPLPILALIHAPINSQSPQVEWRLSADTACFSGTEYSLGTLTPTIGSNTPYAISPSGGYHVPSNTPAGNYRLCAKIDANNQLTETYEYDNIIMSEKLFVVH